MRDPDLAASSRADREINPRVLEHPLRVIVLDNCRGGPEQGRNEPGRRGQIVNGHAIERGESTVYGEGSLARLRELTADAGCCEPTAIAKPNTGPDTSRTCCTG
jgi:hypothetical protein